MIRLIHLADVHLDAPLGGFGEHAEERRGQVLDAFRRLPELAAEVEAHAVLIAGDLFDRPRPSDPVTAAVRETVRRLVDGGVHVFAVPGNHDAATLAPSLYRDTLAGAVVFDRPRFQEPASVEVGDESLHVHGLAHDPAEEPDPLGSFPGGSPSGFHVVLLHGSVPGAPHWEAGSALPLPVERLAELDVDYVALGDYHRFRPPGEFGEGVPACYPGSFAAVDVSEVGPKGVAVVELTAGAPPSVALHPVGGVPAVVSVDFDVTAYPDEGTVADAVGDRIEGSALPIVRLGGEPSFPLDAERVEALLTERFGFASVEDDTRFYDSDLLQVLAKGKTVAGHVARLGLSRIREAPDEESRGVAERGLRIALRAMRVE